MGSSNLLKRGVQHEVRRQRVARESGYCLPARLSAQPNSNEQRPQHMLTHPRTQSCGWIPHARGAPCYRSGTVLTPLDRDSIWWRTRTSYKAPVPPHTPPHSTHSRPVTSSRSVFSTTDTIRSRWRVPGSSPAGTFALHTNSSFTAVKPALRMLQGQTWGHNYTITTLHTRRVRTGGKERLAVAWRTSPVLVPGIR